GDVPAAVGAAGGAGQVDVDSGAAHFVALSPETHDDYVQDGPDVDLPASSFNSSNDPAWIVRFASARKVAGQFHSGTVLLPREPESHWEFTRGKALDEHELSHTRQYGYLGPLMMSAI